MTTRILIGDVFERLRDLPDDSVHMIFTSPPYWGLRAYHDIPGLIGNESTMNEHLNVLVRVFREVARVLRPDGTLWLNYGDVGTTRDKRFHESGFRPKNLTLIPARLAIALQEDEWYVRSEIVWYKTNPVPLMLMDRPVHAHEKVFLMSRRERYFYDEFSIREPGVDFESRAARNVWHIASSDYKGGHFATTPPPLVERCIKAGSSEFGVCAECGAPYRRIVQTIGNKSTGWRDRDTPEIRFNTGTSSIRTVGRKSGDPYRRVHAGWEPTCSHPPIPTGVRPATVLDPFGGAGTTGLVAERLRRDAILIELSPDYAMNAEARLSQDGGLFGDVRMEAR